MRQSKENYADKRGKVRKVVKANEESLNVKWGKVRKVKMWNEWKWGKLKCEMRKSEES